jgi:hypothetical protein
MEPHMNTLRSGFGDNRRAFGAAKTRLIVLLALVAVLCALAAYIYTTRPAPREVAPSEVMKRLTDHGFVPEFICTEPAEFVKTIKDRFGTGLGLRDLPTGIRVFGWAYTNQYEGRVIGEKTLILMAKVNDQPTLVFIDKLSEDRKLTDPRALMGNWTGGDITNPMSLQTSPRSDGKLSLFRHAVGELVLYELTPFEQPELLGRLEPR